VEDNSINKVNFARIPSIIPLPELLEMQRTSYREFLQSDVPVKERKISGLQASFADIFPIINGDESLALEFVQYNLGTPKYTIEEAIDKEISRALSSVDRRVRTAFMLALILGVGGALLLEMLLLGSAPPTMQGLLGLTLIVVGLLLYSLDSKTAD
jgi:hypothetical protein